MRAIAREERPLSVAPPRPRVVPAQAGQQAVDAVATGLAAIAAERTLAGIYRTTCGLAARLSGVAGVMVLRPDDRGFFGVAQAVPEKLADEIVTIAVASLHQRWIAAHAPGAPSTGPGVYAVEDRPELLVA